MAFAGRVYPPQPLRESISVLSSSYGAGAYVLEGSSSVVSAFDGDSTTHYRSDASYVSSGYNGTKATLVDKQIVRGDFIQLELPVLVKSTGIVISISPSSIPSVPVTQFSIVAFDKSFRWTLVRRVSSITNWDPTRILDLHFRLPALNAYSKYRIIFEKAAVPAGIRGAVSLNEIQVFGDEI
jgi:hypothetical protein